MVGWVERVGDGALDRLKRTGGTCLLLFEALVEMVRPPYDLMAVGREIHQIGGRSLGVVGVLGVCFGMAFVQQTGITMKRFGADMYVGRLVALAVFRELGPILAGFMVAARAGSGIAAEIGTMCVTEQLDAMRACGANPVRLLVVPKLIAATIVLPLLTAVANVLGVLGGLVTAVAVVGLDGGYYLSSIPDSLRVGDFAGGLFKTLFFGLIIASVSCYEGLNAGHGSLGVSEAATRTVVRSTILILIADLIITGFMFALGGVLQI